MSPAMRRRIRNRIGRGLTFEKVWATIERNAQEAEKRYAEWEAKWQKEAEERKKEEAEREAKRQKEAEERKKEEAEREAKRLKEAEERKKEEAEREAKRLKEAEERKKEEAEREAEREAKRLKEAEERKKEEAEREAKRLKEAEERKKEAEERQKEAEKRWKKTERIVEAVSRQMGGLHNSFGEMAEFMVAPGVVDLFNDIGFHITEDVTPNKRILDEKKRLKAEIDLYMGNGDYIIAVEVKTSLGKNDIEHHRKRLEILREHINKTGDRRKILGGMAVAVLDGDGRKAILDAGFYLLEPSGDMMKLDLPEGFAPREF